MNLIFLTFSLYPENSGQSIYSAAMARSLSDYTNLYVFAYTGNHIDTNKDEFKNFKKIKFYKYKGKKSLRNFIYKMIVVNYIDNDMLHDIKECIYTNKIHYIVIDHIGMTSYYFYLKKRFPYLKFIYLSHNVESLNIKDSLLSGTRNKKFWRIRVFLHKRLERKVLKTVDKIISISEDDTRFFINNLKIKTPIFQSHPRYRFANVWDENRIEDFRKEIIIVGSMNWYPNVSGTIKFVEESFSELLKYDSDYKLFIIGKNPTKEIQNLAKKYEQIIVTGFVNNVDDYYSRCDVAVVPVYEGTGIKIKLIEAAGKGVPIITTRFAAKGYSIIDEVFFADNKDEFIQAINKLSNNKDVRRKKHYGSLNLYNDIICDTDFWNKIFCR